MAAPVFYARNPLAGPDGATRGYLPGDAVSTSDPKKAEKVANSPGVTLSSNTNYLFYIFGIVALLIALRYAGEKSDGPQPSIAGVGVYNFFVIGIMAMLFILTGKVIFNKYPVKGLSDLFNAV